MDTLLLIYLKGGDFDANQFFEDNGITKVGNKRVFERWFRDFLAEVGG